MARKLIINPLTRISGFAEIEVTIENNKIAEAMTKGFLFRGFEKILKGRPPLDAIYLTQRICGICSAAHSMGSTLALEDALNIIPPEQGRYLRDFLHGCEFLQNHIRHFYQYTVPDFVRLPEVSTIYSKKNGDYRLPEKVNKRISGNYFASLEYSRQAHEMLAVLGGKAPHNHGIFINGITTQPAADKIIKIKSILNKIKEFIENKMIPDVYCLAEYYSDCLGMGESYGNFLSYGCFDNYSDLGSLYVEPNVYSNGQKVKLNPDKITENIDYSWYDNGPSTYKPFETVPEADREKSRAYSWVKAPRYMGLPFEVGPLARLWLTGEYRRGISAMDRTIARVLEARKITAIMVKLLENIMPDISVQQEYTVPLAAQGSGLVDTTRGALGHWLKIENKVLSFYQIITPTVWNFSSRDSDFRGVAEKALIGTPIENKDNPVEIGRILRSFDPCISCATHIYIPGHEVRTIQIV
ncbi:MAG: Ni/Fe hydrogenase [Firmicutes bacterium HGW-Firmicutes-14]|nr:MAG: Ni/Fe hydrogenase [Firmicutes bacterium HGW-Firmicutes-14]